MTKETAIEKIRKLLALSTSSNVHEAATAAAMAQELMLQHKLLNVDLGADDEDEVVQGIDFEEETTRRISWRSKLIFGVAKNNFCRAVGGFKRSITGRRVRYFTVVGTKSDAETVVYLFKYLTNEITRLAESADGEGKAFYNSFKLGAADEIVLRMKTAKEARDAAFKASADLGNAQASTALTVIGKSDKDVAIYIRKTFGRLGSGFGTGPTDGGGYAAGRAAGATVGLPGKNRALGQAAQQITT